MSAASTSASSPLGEGSLDEGSIKADYINTQDQLADLLTKSLGRVKFQEMCARIGMAQIPQKASHKT